MKLWLLFFFFHAGNHLKVYTFESSSGTNLSYATLESPAIRSLPETFIFCSSYKETTIDGKSFFTIYSEDENPWLTLSVWDLANDGKCTMWARMRTTWKKMGNLERFWLNFWIHYCIRIDTRSGQLTISVNGELPVSIEAK